MTKETEMKLMIGFAAAGLAFSFGMMVGWGNGHDTGVIQVRTAAVEADVAEWPGPNGEIEWKVADENQ